MGAPAELLALVPDEPVWLEARSLLCGEPPARLWQAPGRAAFVCADPDFGVVVGPAPAAWICEAADGIVPGGSLLGYRNNHEHVRAALPAGWTCEEAAIYRLKPADPGAAAEPDPAEVRWMTRGDLAVFSPEEGALRAELAEVLARTRIAVATEANECAAFCYADETEKWWDVSIDTRGAFRRRGHAVRCVQWMIARQRERGREPVWGAVASNRASRGLAARLGFAAVDKLWVFTAPSSL